MSNRNLFSMNIFPNGNPVLSSDRVIQFLIAIYLSFSLIYKIPSVGNIDFFHINIFKQSVFVLLAAFLMLYKHSYKKIIYFISLIVLISIFQLNILLNTSFEGNIKFLYLISTAIFFIIYLKEDYLEKYFNKSIIVIALFSAFYIFCSYYPSYFKYDIRTFTFGIISTNWSIGLAFIILYSVKKNIPFAFIAIIYYAQLISGGRAGLLTTIVGCLILFTIKKKYYQLLLILIVTVSYNFIKPTRILNMNSDRQYLFFHDKSQLNHILSDLNPFDNFPGLDVCGEIVRTNPAYRDCIEKKEKKRTEKTKIEKTKIEKAKVDLIPWWDKLGIDKPESSIEDFHADEIFRDIQQMGKAVNNGKVRIDHLLLREGLYVLVKTPMVVIGRKHRSIRSDGYLMLVVTEVSDTEVDDIKAKVISKYECRPEAVEQIILEGADIVKTGTRPGSTCTTRKKTRIGYPQLSCIIKCADAAHGLGGHVMADGGGDFMWRGEYLRLDSFINISNEDVIAVSEDNKTFHIVYPKTLASLIYMPLEFKFKKIEGYQHNLEGWIFEIPFFSKIDFFSGYRLQQIVIGLRLFKDKIFGRDFDTAGKIRIKNGQLFELHNTFFFHSIRGGLFFSLIYIFLIYTSIKTSDKINRAFLCCGLIPSFFEPYVLIGGYNMCFLWWIVYAKSISDQFKNTKILFFEKLNVNNPSLVVGIKQRLFDR